MASQRDVRNRIASVQNIRTITRAMEMVAAARLRRAEQRIEALRPYADAIRRMTREAAEAAGQVPNLPILNEHESVQKVGLLLVAGDRGLAGAFNSQIVRAGVAAGREHESEGRQSLFFASGRRPASSLTFRGLEPVGGFTGFSDRPSFADAREIADRLIAAYVDGEVDRVDVFYNGYVSAISQVVRRETLLPLQQATILDEGAARGQDGARRGSEQRRGAEAQRVGRVRARSGRDPRPAGAGLRRDLDLPGAARVDRVRARRADDGDAQRLRERGRADR